MSCREVKHLLEVTPLIMKETGIELKFIWFQSLWNFRVEVNPSLSLPLHGVLMTFLKIWSLSFKITHSLSGKRIASWPPAMTFQVGSKRNSCRSCTDIPRVFILSFWKEGGVGSTQNYNVFSLLLPKCSFRAASVPPSSTQSQPDVLPPTYHVLARCS